MTENNEKILRFDKFRRIEHVLLIASFTTLAITGLIQKYPNNAVSLGLVTLLGGIPFVRIIHRIAAVMFLLEAVYHFVVMGYILFVQRKKPTMAPGPKDAVDAIQATAHNLGLRKEAPKMGRYNFAEKAEYWALDLGFVHDGLDRPHVMEPDFHLQIPARAIHPGSQSSTRAGSRSGSVGNHSLAFLPCAYQALELEHDSRNDFTRRNGRRAHAGIG